MSKEYIIIEDSGDLGVKGSSTSHFIIIAIVVVGDDVKDRLIACIDEYRNDLGWKETHEFKFNSTKKSIIEEFIKRVCIYNFSAYAMVLDKSKIPIAPEIISGISLYNYIIKELLINLDFSNPYITIDGIGNKKHEQKVRAYLRQNLKAKGIIKSEIKFADSRKDSMIQLADIVAGSVARSFSDKRSNATKFLGLFKERIVQIDELTL